MGISIPERIVKDSPFKEERAITVLTKNRSCNGASCNGKQRLVGILSGLGRNYADQLRLSSIRLVSTRNLPIVFDPVELRSYTQPVDREQPSTRAHESSESDHSA